MAKLELPVKVCFGEIDEIIKELRQLQTYKLFEGAEEVLVDIDDVARILANHVKATTAEPEIIRCKDCRWWDKSEDSPYGYCMAMKHGYMSANWEIGIYRLYKGDFYCADAEREEVGERE